MNAHPLRASLQPFLPPPRPPHHHPTLTPILPETETDQEITQTPFLDQKKTPKWLIHLVRYASPPGGEACENICTLPHGGPRGGFPAVANICERVPKVGRWPNGGGSGVRGGLYKCSRLEPGEAPPQHLSGVAPHLAQLRPAGVGQGYHN